MKMEFAHVCSDEEIFSRKDELKEMRSIFLSGYHVTDNSMKFLARNCEDLRELHLMSTGVTDVGMDHISRISTLDWVVLDTARVYDTGLQHFSRLLNLRGLHLINTLISHQGLEFMAELPELVYLETRGELSRAGLQVVSRMPTLQFLRVSSGDTDDDDFLRVAFGASLLRFSFDMPLVTKIAEKTLKTKFPDRLIDRYQFSMNRSSLYQASGSNLHFVKNEILNLNQMRDARPLTKAEVNYLVASGQLTRADVERMRRRGMLSRKNFPVPAWLGLKFNGASLSDYPETPNTVPDYHPPIGPSGRIIRPEEILRTLLAEEEEAKRARREKEDDLPWSW
ncbi:MAG: hypothetical protein K2Z81_13405 [Cyanobacteria bacterium]|nr:hypothetical protein [Cyanobacteriota bacterium]